MSVLDKLASAQGQGDEGGAGEAGRKGDAGDWEAGIVPLGGLRRVRKAENGH